MSQTQETWKIFVNQKIRNLNIFAEYKEIWWDLAERVERLAVDHCQSRNSPGFDLSILRHRGICTVIHFLWVSAKFGTCTVVSINGTLVEAKMFTFTLESTHFIFNWCPIYPHDGASAKFSTNPPLTHKKRITVWGAANDAELNKVHKKRKQHGLEMDVLKQPDINIPIIPHCMRSVKMLKLNCFL